MDLWNYLNQVCLDDLMLLNVKYEVGLDDLKIFTIKTWQVFKNSNLQSRFENSHTKSIYNII